MKSCLFALLLSLLLPGCSSQYPKAEDPLDAGREFIDATLKGDFEKARAYMLSDEANEKAFGRMVNGYRQKSNEQKTEYHNASINILEEDTVSDSVHIISYKNSFDNIARKLKVTDTKDGWLVDLAYTFSGNL